MVLVCGIDEAGKGPVIGPLVIGAVLIKESSWENLKSLGVKDSKLLNEKQRELLYPQITEMIERSKIVFVSPQEIDKAVDGEDGMNLNWLEANKTADILNDLQPDKAYIDCPSPNIWKYTQFLKKLLNKNIELVVEHKAEKYPPVAAASILAKVERDRAIMKIKEKYGDCGPGYQSNEKTQRFIRENWDKHPEIFRKSWSTYKDLVKGKEQKNLGEF